MCFDALIVLRNGAAVRRPVRPFPLPWGDGNHSLATAYWQAVKPALRPERRECRPARLCPAELGNLHSPAIGIEVIHRAVTGATLDRLRGDVTDWMDCLLYTSRCV